MKLYIKSGACSLSPHIVLRESGLEFSVVKVDLATKRTENGDDFLAINPKGQVPALLLDDGSLLTEGVVIVQYLADQVPDRHLLPPAGTMARYHALEWLNYIATELHKGFSPLFNPTTPEEFKVIVRQQLDKKLRYVNQELQDKPWATGSQFTVVDAYLFTVLSWAYALKLDIAEFSNIGAFVERMKARPAVSATLAAEGL